MGGGIIQLVAYGEQDAHLTGNPQVTFFKNVFRRHTNFSMETIQQVIQGSSVLTSSPTNGTVTISRNGDLISDVYVSTSTTGVHHGDQIVTDVELEIGGQSIDKQTKEWMQIWEELTTPATKQYALKTMKKSDSNGIAGLTIIPLQFWFCRNHGLALPLIALQYHEVILKFNFGTSDYSSVGIDASIEVWCDYIYLDADERRRFAQVSHEYLIEQIQYKEESSSNNIELKLNHPVKELIWTSAVTNTYGNLKIVMNGHDRFYPQEEEYFQLRHPIKYHTAVPAQNMAHVGMPSFVGTKLTSLFSTTQTAPQKFEAEEFSNITVTPTKVIISETSAGGIEDLSGIAVVAASGGVTAASLVYSFLKSDLQGHGHLPHIGDMLEFNVSGIGATVNAATGLSNSHSILAKVTGVADGSLLSGLASTDNYHIQLSESLCESTLGAAIDGADDFTIHSIKNISVTQAATSTMRNRINVYSFALRPEEHQPSGTCNFSRIDDARLIFNDVPVPSGKTFTIYAVNYNILRIISGMAGLAYSN